MAKRETRVTIRPPRSLVIGMSVPGLLLVGCLVAWLVLGAIVLAGEDGEWLFLAVSPWLRGIGSGSGALFLILSVYSIVCYSRTEHG